MAWKKVMHYWIEFDFPCSIFITPLKDNGFKIQCKYFLPLCVISYFKHLFSYMEKLSVSTILKIQCI